MLKMAFSALLLLAPLTACASSDDDGKPDVVASFYPLAWVAEQVVGDHASVTNLTSPGQEPHDLELTVRQTAEVGSATIAFYTQGLQPGVDEAIAQAGDVHAVDAGEYAGLETPAEEHAHEDDHEGEHAEEHDHDHGGTDPHFWLDPTRLAKAADAFADAMADEDPDNASSYEANAAALQEELATLDAEFRTGLETCRTRAIVVSHDAFGYLGSRYDLHVVPIAGISPDAEPSARTLAEIRSEAQEEGVSTVFAERLASPALADTLAGELGVKVAVLDPLEGLTQGAKGDYLSIMRENLQALRTVNGCS